MDKYVGKFFELVNAYQFELMWISIFTILIRKGFKLINGTLFKTYHKSEGREIFQFKIPYITYLKKNSITFIIIVVFLFWISNLGIKDISSRESFTFLAVIISTAMLFLVPEPAFVVQISDDKIIWNDKTFKGSKLETIKLLKGDIEFINSNGRLKDFEFTYFKDQEQNYIKLLNSIKSFSTKHDVSFIVDTTIEDDSQEENE